ncbi:MAG: GtrA family protein [Lachnospiraceae bacterium]|nr:GtrA family protein [Lachnospiraceae bacterium]
MELTSKLFQNEKSREIIMYLIVGGATTVVSWVTYAIAESNLDAGKFISKFIKTFTHLKISSTSIEIFLAGIISWIIAVLFAYFTNKIFVFESKNWKPDYVLDEIFLFVSSRLATGAFEIIMVPILVAIGLNQTIFGIEGFLSKIVVSVFVVIANYVLSKLYVFNREEGEGVLGNTEVISKE